MFKSHSGIGRNVLVVCILGAGAIAPLLATVPALAQETAPVGGTAVAITPTRIDFGPRDRTATITLANQSTVAQRYRVEIADMRQRPDGSIQRQEDGSAPYSAKDWLVATPRSFTVEPGGAQAVRVLLRRPANMEDGEYRAHVLIAQEPPREAGGQALASPNADDTVSFDIVTTFTSGVAVFVNQGETRVDAKIKSARLNADGDLDLVIESEGNRTFRGTVTVKRGGQEFPGTPVIIYRELGTLETSIDLDRLAGTSGPLTVELMGSPTGAPDQAALLDTVNVGS